MTNENKENIDTLLKKAKNKFLLSNAVAGRAKQISEGSLPYVNDFDPTNPIITSIREIARDKIRIKLITADSKKPIEIKMVDPEEEVSALEKLAKGSKRSLKRKKN